MNIAVRLKERKKRKRKKKKKKKKFAMSAFIGIHLPRIKVIFIPRFCPRRALLKRVRK
jgi:hypothetical protein